MNIPGNGLGRFGLGRAYVGRDGCNMVGDHPLWRHAEYQYAGRAGTGVCPRSVWRWYLFFTFLQCPAV